MVTAAVTLATSKRSFRESIVAAKRRAKELEKQIGIHVVVNKGRMNDYDEL